MQRVFVIGDSISIQYGPYLEASLAGVMAYARKSGADAVLENLDVAQGANGGDSGRVLAYLRALQAAGGIAADLLLINCGLHDIKTDPANGAKQVPLDRYRNNLEAIVATSRSLQPNLVWIRTTPCDERIHNSVSRIFYRFAADCNAYNAAADEIMQAHGVPMIDLHRFTLNLDDPLYCDHVHFHDIVRRQQAVYIAGWLDLWRQKP